MPSLSSNLAPRRFWLLWAAWMALNLVIHSTTLLISPPIWQDEVSIIEFGRTALDPASDWSINWNVTTDRPVLYPLYLGGLVQNISFALSGYNILFPRFLSVLGAIVASSSCLLLLVAFGHGRIRSAIFSSILLLDPIFVMSYRGDRVDCWVIAAGFLSCLLLQNSRISGLNKLRSPMLVILSGAIAAVGLSFWFSFVLLVPLMIWQIVNIATDGRMTLISSRKAILSVSLFWILGFFGTLFLIQIPIFIGQSASYTDLLRATIRVTNLRDTTPAIISFITSFRMNPLLLLMAVLCIFLRPRWDILLFLGIALAMILKSTTYTHRVVYILPYLVIFSSFSIHRFLPDGVSFGHTPWIYRGIRSLLWICLAVSIFVSLFLRPLNAMATKAVRLPSLVEQVAVQAVGEGEFKVFVEPWEFYISGRKLGWKMYNPQFENFDPSQISEMDFILLSKAKKLQSALPAGRFVQVGDTWLPRPTSSLSRVDASAVGYGPYLIYKNAKLLNK